MCEAVQKDIQNSKVRLIFNCSYWLDLNLITSTLAQWSRIVKPGAYSALHMSSFLPLPLLIL